VRLPRTLGIANAAVSGSYGRGQMPANAAGGDTGGLVSLGFQRTLPSLSLSVGGTVATKAYRDIAAVNGSPVPASTLNASLGYQLGDWGNIGVAYLRQVSRAQPITPLNASLDFTSIINPQVSLVTASYSIPVAGFASFYATGFMDLHPRRRRAYPRTTDFHALRSHGRLASDRRSLRVRLLTHPLWRRRCLKTHPGLRRPLFAPNLARFFSRWNCHAGRG
jgi:hypothetical protein